MSSTDCQTPAQLLLLFFFSSDSRLKMIASQTSPGKQDKNHPFVFTAQHHLPSIRQSMHARLCVSDASTAKTSSRCSRFASLFLILSLFPSSHCPCLTAHWDQRSAGHEAGQSSRRDNTLEYSAATKTDGDGQSTYTQIRHD